MAREHDEQPELFHSVDHFLGSPAFEQQRQDEFAEDAAEWLDPVTRRQFVALMGASAALAAAAGCNPSLKPASQKKVLPYVKKPEEIIPGVPLFFATAFELAGQVTGVLVKSTEGRPIKVEGNPSHPASLGAADRFAQASVLDLYDPDRSKRPIQGGNPASWDKAKAALGQLMDAQVAKRGAGFRVLSGAVTSPTLAALMGELKARLPDMKWVQYEPAGGENALKGARLAFGKYVAPRYDFSKADVIVAIDSDYLAASTGADVRYTRDTMARRKLRVGHDKKAGDGVRPDKLNRLYAVESAPTNTGAVADHRVPLRPTEVESFVRELARAAGVAGVPAAGPLPEAARITITHLLQDAQKAAGNVAVIAGESLSPVGHALVHAVNAKLGAVGKTVVYHDPAQAGLTGPDADATADATGSLKALAADMAAGKVDALLILGSNPVFTAPADLEFTDALAKVKTAIHVGSHQDETADRCQWHINAAHYLETWGDVRAFDGTVTVQQPLIAPLHDGRSFLEVVAVLLNRETADPQLLVKGTWAKQLGDPAAWAAALKEGVIPGTAAAPAQVAVVAALPDEVVKSPAPATGKDDLELAFRPDPTLFDGRFANNGWLQELPKPLTRIAWDNYALVSAATADRIGCGLNYDSFIRGPFPLTAGEHGRFEAQVVEVTVGKNKVRLPVFVLPGMPDDVIAVPFGAGRRRGVGEVQATAGINVYPLRTAANPWSVGGLKPKESVVRTGEKFLLACTQGQHAMEGRRPSRWGTADQVREFLKTYDDHSKGHHQHVTDFADNPPVAGNERQLLQINTPGSAAERQHLEEKYPTYKDHTHAASHRHDEKDGDHHGHGPHDARLVPLNLVGEWDKNKLYRRWAMAIDLGACTGCTACVVACQAENNIPVIGKTEVTRGRIMHWIRVDRYFSVNRADAPTEEERKGEEGGVRKMSAAARYEALKKFGAEVTTHFQPLPCMQCEKAPCELVCPVNATAHSADGLNDMAYNRCVGTRYCANNCPYKVRRFNFYQYANYAEGASTLVNNPEVTVRTRGVMEKCTYCVQRIRNAEMEAEREHDNPSRPLVQTPLGVRPLIRDGEILTACQAACPANAISFGDLNYDQYQPVKKTADGKYEPAGRRLGFSEVSRWKLEPTHYGLLTEQNTMPRTTYLAAVRNPNEALVQALADRKERA